MTTTLEKLIEETKANCNSLEKETAEYIELLDTLTNSFKKSKQILSGNTYQFKLGFSYHPNSYNGRKICFSSSDDDKHYPTMIRALIVSNRIEDFLMYVVETAIPLFLSDDCINEFHF